MRRICQRRMPITHLNDCFSLSLHLFVANRMKTGEEEEEAYLMIRQFFKQIAVNGEIQKEEGELVYYYQFEGKLNNLQDEL